MVAHDGGSKNLEAVIKHKIELERVFQFNNEQIVRIIGRNGGSKIIEDITKYQNELKTLSLGAEQIVQIVEAGGYQKIEEIVNGNQQVTHQRASNKKVSKIKHSHYNKEDSQDNDDEQDSDSEYHETFQSKRRRKEPLLTVFSSSQSPNFFNTSRHESQQDLDDNHQPLTLD